MRNTILLVLAVGMLAYVAYSQRFVLQEQRRLTQQLNTTLSMDASLGRQERCAKQALEEFKAQGLEAHKGDDYANFSDHYNERLNKCFVQINYTNTANNAIFSSEEVLDAFEGKEYGHWYQRMTQKAIIPVECKVKLPSGEEKKCNSKEEFESMVKPYME